ncbi:MAG: hypothetical protein ACOH2K_12250 [Burkholderiaceae bacterium]
MLHNKPIPHPASPLKGKEKTIPHCGLNSYLNLIHILNNGGMRKLLARATLLMRPRVFAGMEVDDLITQKLPN